MRFGLDNEFFQVYNYIKLGVIAALAIFGLVLCLADGDSAHELIGIWKPLYFLIPVTFLLISGTVLIYSILNSFRRKFSSNFHYSSGEFQHSRDNKLL